MVILNEAYKRILPDPIFYFIVLSINLKFVNEQCNFALPYLQNRVLNKNSYIKIIMNLNRDLRI